MTFTVQDFFLLGMKRQINELKKPNTPALNLGAGNSLIDGTIPLDFPRWDADKDPIPYSDCTINTIHAYHFLEHLKDPVKVLLECQRVLKYGGTMNIVVPYYSSNLYATDLDHKHSFTENTWRILFGNEYYDKLKIEWKFAINFNVIIGIEERCLALFTQLIKV